jgi:hypothetical protein
VYSAAVLQSSFELVRHGSSFTNQFGSSRAVFVPPPLAPRGIDQGRALENNARVSFGRQGRTTVLDNYLHGMHSNSLRAYVSHASPFLSGWTDRLPARNYPRHVEYGHVRLARAGRASHSCTSHFFSDGHPCLSRRSFCFRFYRDLAAHCRYKSQAAPSLQRLNLGKQPPQFPPARWAKENPALDICQPAVVRADVVLLVVPTVGGASASAAEHPRGRLYLQRTERRRVGDRAAVVIAKHQRVASPTMTGPVSVDDFVVVTRSCPASSTSLSLANRTTRGATMKPPHYAPEIVDLDVLSDADLVDGQYRLSFSAPEMSGNDKNNNAGTPLGEAEETTIATGSTSECSTDDSYQADLRNGSLGSSSDDDDDEEDRDHIGEPRKRVSFTSVSLRVYAPMVSDSPNASTTYPIGLDWKHSEAVTLPLEEFEDERSSRLLDDRPPVLLRGGFRRPRRLSPTDRFHRISDLSGLSHGEIYELEHARARRHLRPRTSSSSATPVKGRQGGFSVYQVVDIDSGYHRVDI